MVFVYLGIAVAMLIGGIMLVARSYRRGLEGVGFGLTVIGGLAVLIIGMASITVPLSIHAWLAQYNATKSTIEHVRINGTIEERAALNHKIIDANVVLANHQYWASFPFFGSFYPDKIRDIQPLK